MKGRQKVLRPSAGLAGSDMIKHDFRYSYHWNRTGRKDQPCAVLARQDEQLLGVCEPEGMTAAGRLLCVVPFCWRTTACVDFEQ